MAQSQIKSESENQIINEFLNVLEKLNILYSFEPNIPLIRIYGDIKNLDLNLESSLIYELSLCQNDTKCVEVFKYRDYIKIRIILFEKGDMITFKFQNPIIIRYQYQTLILIF